MTVDEDGRSGPGCRVADRESRSSWHFLLALEPRARWRRVRGLGRARTRLRAMKPGVCAEPRAPEDWLAGHRKQIYAEPRGRLSNIGADVSDWLASLCLQAIAKPCERAYQI